MAKGDSEPPVGARAHVAHTTHRLSLAQQRVAQAFRDRMMSVLLGLLVAIVFVIPVMNINAVHARLLADALLTALLVVGIMAVSDKRRIMLLLAVSSALALVFRWSEWILPRPILSDVRDISLILSLFVMSVAVAVNVFGPGGDVINRIVGAVALYLLIGMVWAVGYLVVADAHPGAFNVATPGNFPLSNWLYFSFVTLTTVGYGDITPVLPVARSMAMIEALIGQLYPAIILARLVAAHGGDRPQK